jgi:hypothetical protein
MAGQVTGLLSERTPWRTLEGEATMPNKRPRGPQPRSARPKRETLRVLAAVEVVLDRYRDHLPVSLRQLFYVLLSDGVLAKTEHEYKRMCEYVGMARRSGRIAGTRSATTPRSPWRRWLPSAAPRTSGRPWRRRSTTTGSIARPTNPSGGSCGARRPVWSPTGPAQDHFHSWRDTPALATGPCI